MSASNYPCWFISVFSYPGIQNQVGQTIQYHMTLQTTL